MPYRKIIDFLFEYLHNEHLRARILHREMDALLRANLSQPDAETLTDLHKREICLAIKNEIAGLTDNQWIKVMDRAFKRMGVDVERIHDEIYPTHPHLVRTTTTTSTYSQGAIHIREVTPNSGIPANSPVPILIRGQGFGPNSARVPLDVRFSQGSSAQADVEVGRMTCDVDVSQRLTVVASFPSSGNWALEAQNGTDTPGLWPNPIVVV